MKQSIYLADNNKEIQDKLAKLGYHICVCCNFGGAEWLHFHHRENPDTLEFHGIGYSCECECEGYNSKKCIMCSLTEALECKEDIHIFHTVEDTDNFIKQLIKN